MKKAYIKTADFRRHIDDYLHLRLLMNHQPSSVCAARKDLNLFLEYIQKQGIKRINGATLLDFFAMLRSERNNSSGAINRKQSSLRMYIKHLALKQVPGAAQFPAQYLPRARDPYKGPVKTLEFKEIKKLLQSIDIRTTIGLRDYTLFGFIYAIGLRLGEALAINIDDIDFKNKQILIHGKGRRERTVPLTNPVLSLLRRWITCRAAFLNAGTEKALFISKKGNRLSLRTAEDNFKKIVRKAGPFSMDKVVPHTLRHAFASHAIDGGGDVLVLKTILGHASIKTTELYLHPSPEVLRNAVNNHVASDILYELIKSKKVRLRMQHYRKTGTG